MIPLKAVVLVLAMASSLLLAGCYTYDPITPEQYRRNPEILKPGDTVIVHTSNQSPVKGSVIARSDDTIVLNVHHKVQESVSTDKLTLVEVRHVSGLKIFGLTILGAAGVAAIVGVVYLIGLAFRAWTAGF